MRLRLFAALVIVAGSLFAADSSLINLVMPDAQFIAGGNVEQVMRSPFGQFLLSNSPMHSDPVLQKLAETTGFEFDRDLHQILVAGRPGTDTWLMLARGTFDVARIVEAAVADGAAAGTYAGSQILDWSGSRHPSVAFTNDGVAVIGKPDSVRAALDHGSAPTAINPSLAAEVNSLRADQDAWFVSITPPAAFEGKAAGPLALLNSVVSASGGMRFGSELLVSLKAVCRTAADAGTLAEGLKSIGMLAGSQGAPPGFAGVLRSLQASVAGETVMVSVSIPEEQLEQMVKSGPSGTVGYDIHMGRRKAPSSR